ncbi:MAG: nicotinamide-nucleotide amidohydrolase family protein [Candidatus Omnitrophica bacterium]|nr:nicotinamide-nucleotide amidohydrolase family protein [Candidatus Omnitrophota bacterium]
MKIEQKVAKLLISEKKSLSIAESCTGGLLSNRLTNISGSSAFLKLGIVTYSNDAKVKLLKVPAEIIKKHGAVSFQTAIAMAKGCKKLLNTDFSIGLSGIAGPTGGTRSKPVGLVYIAICSNYETICLECIFTGTRSNIKSKAATQAFKLLLEFL